MIHDLSYPKGRGVNDLILPTLLEVSYEDFDRVSSIIVDAGVNTLIAKVDIQSAFCILPIFVFMSGSTGPFLAFCITNRHPN